MMKLFNLKYIFLLLALLNGASLAAQNGEYEVRAREHLVDLDNMKYQVDLEIKASNSATNFLLADHNFVLTFDEAVIDNPALEAELYIAGFLMVSPYTAIYGPHTINGSVDSFLVYNVEMSGGTGYPVDEVEWLAVGRVSFDILDPTGNPNLVWRNSEGNPPTVVLEKVDNIDLVPIMDGIYNDKAGFNFTALNDSIDAYQEVSSSSFPLMNDIGNADPNSLVIVVDPLNGAASFDGEELTFLADAAFVGMDSLQYAACDLALPTACDSAWVVFNVQPLTCDSNTDCVWPGDTDNNTLVDHFDVLNLGIAYGATGPQRPNASLNWEAQPAAEWAQSTPLTAVDYKHVDTDGNGLVEDLDTMAISQNWGASYNPVNFAPKTGDIPFFIDTITVNPDTTVYLPLVLGDIDFPVTGAYGLAFSIVYDEDIVLPASAVLILNDSWLGAEADILMMQRSFDLEGRLDVGLTRIDGLPASGAGQIGVLQLTIKDDVLFDFKEVDLHLLIENVRLQKITEEEIHVDPQSSTVTITDAILGFEEQESIGLSIFPNPVAGLLQIQAEETIDLRISNLIGQVVYEGKGVVDRSIDTSNWPTGIYTITARKTAVVYSWKLLKK